ncbi:MAG: hypothetical protein V3T63_03645 [Nitrosopumilaceae archaeon]|jgi:hypothetical protein|nr:MAG: hypothetical protein NPMRD1_100028 [Nitrosopumilales archaeon]
MTNSFSDFYESLLELVKSFEKKNTMLKIEEDLESNIISIFGENITSISRAKNGIEAVAELAYTTAEHHPYWALLYHCTQISKSSLEKWNDDFTKDELDEIEWSIDELKHTCKKLKEQLKND